MNRPSSDRQGWRRLSAVHGLRRPWPLPGRNAENTGAFFGAPSPDGRRESGLLQRCIKLAHRCQRIRSMPANQNLRGMLSMLLAVATFSLMDAALKTLTPNYPPMQVAALRGLSSLPLVTLWVLVDGGPRQLLRVRWPLHVLRGLVSIVMIAAFAYALRTLPLAETYSLFFVAPLMITALAALVLGERVDWRGWTAIVIGFCGTLIVLRPTGAGVLTLAGLAVLVSATGYSISA